MKFSYMTLFVLLAGLSGCAPHNNKPLQTIQPTGTLIIKPISFKKDADIRDAVKQECGLDGKLTQFIKENASGQYANIVTDSNTGPAELCDGRLASVKPVTFVMSFEDGWVWHIVLREKTSVGLIVPTGRTRGMDRQQREVFFKQTCASLPHLCKLLEPACFIEGSLQFRPDYSYYSNNICGENYYCIGDAATFVDPIFSHGVQNALYNAAAATLAIKESLKNKKQRLRYSQLCESRMQQFYGFSRALSLGDFGCNGVNPGLVKNLMKSLPPLELELILVASEMTNRSKNFRKLAKEAGVLGPFEESFSSRKRVPIVALDF